jgi:uncharacterized RDD family membrane protein YckC
MSKWFYTQNGRQVGPVDQALLQDLVTSGHVQTSDMAWKDGMSGWQTISILPELSGPLAVHATAPDEHGPHEQSDPRDQVRATVTYCLVQTPAGGFNAGFWLRVAAYFIDYIFVAVPLVCIFLFVFGTEGLNPDNPSMVRIMPMVKISLFVPFWLYYAIQESSARQATFGKRILGLRVVDNDGQRISFSRASARFFGKVLSGLICSIGYIMAGFTAQKQALHDIIAGTFVVTTWE